MSRKVFISVLGTGFYGGCRYVRGKFSSNETRYIQQATLEYLDVKEKWKTTDKDGNACDRVMILVTEGSYANNWDKNITFRFNNITKTEEPYTGLEQVLNDMNLPCPIEAVPIPDGKSEEEMWAIFNTVYSKLETHDELYFDLTHSFRYLPMLILVLGNYAKFLKNVTIKHISYGNYEARDKNTNEAPLMDILPLTILQDWTFAAADLIRNGNIERLQKLKESNALMPILRTKGKNSIDRKVAEQPLTGYIDSLDKILGAMKLCLAPQIIEGNIINDVYTYHKLVINAFSDIIAPVPPIIDKIQDSLSSFEQTTKENPSNLRNGYKAAKWCYDHQLYQQAFTILDENITTTFCILLETDKHIYKQRKATNDYLRHGGYRENDWKDEDITNDLRKKVKNPSRKTDVENFLYLFREIATWIHDKRNTYNHASMGRSETLTTEDIISLGQKITSTLNLVK